MEGMWEQALVPQAQDASEANSTRFQQAPEHGKKGDDHAFHGTTSQIGSFLLKSHAVQIVIKPMFGQ